MTMHRYTWYQTAPADDVLQVEVRLPDARPGDILPTGEEITELGYARPGHTRVFYRDTAGYERSRVLSDFTMVTRAG
jgi:hypothetical protein